MKQTLKAMYSILKTPRMCDEFHKALNRREQAQIFDSNKAREEERNLKQYFDKIIKQHANE